jgi:hypothetical protein
MFDRPWAPSMRGADLGIFDAASAAYFCPCREQPLSVILSEAKDLRGATFPALSPVRQPLQAEVLPSAIDAFNELNLPAAQPTLNFLLPRNRLPDINEIFKIN